MPRTVPRHDSERHDANGERPAAQRSVGVSRRDQPLPTLVRPEQLRTIRLAASPVASLDEPLRADSALARADVLVDERAQEPLESSRRSSELESNLRAVLDELPERERDVLRLHYGLGESLACSLDDIGKRMGVSRERVRQIESEAIRKLRGSPRLRRALLHS